jgi:transposase
VARLFLGKGKGGTALQAFRKPIACKVKQIKAVKIDMSNAYSAWVAEVLPHCEIIYDHFHVIKLMNERMDNLRRSSMNKLAEEQKRAQESSISVRRPWHSCAGVSAFTQYLQDGGLLPNRTSRLYSIVPKSRGLSHPWS